MKVNDISPKLYNIYCVKYRKDDKLLQKISFWKTQYTYRFIYVASVLYSVPQISMKLKQLNDEHQKMLGFYLDFWRKHRDTLINGRIIAENPETNYSIVCAKGKGQSIYTAYTDCLIDGTNEKEVIAVNATRHSELIFKNLKDRNYRIVNCMGEEVAKGTLAGELSALKVPLCGIVFVE